MTNFGQPYSYFDYFITSLMQIPNTDLKPLGIGSDDFSDLIVSVLVDNSWLKGMKERIHQPLTLPQSLSGLRPIWADVPAETILLAKLQELGPSQSHCLVAVVIVTVHESSQGYLRHPEVFLKTVVHSALISLEESAESFLQPECGMMISSVSVWSPLLMTIIFSGSCEERFHRVPAGEIIQKL